MIVKARSDSDAILPYPMDDIERDGDGVLRYTKLPPSLVADAAHDGRRAAPTPRRWSSSAASG